MDFRETGYYLYGLTLVNDSFVILPNPTSVFIGVGYSDVKITFCDGFGCLSAAPRCHKVIH